MEIHVLLLRMLHNVIKSVKFLILRTYNITYLNWITIRRDSGEKR